MKKVKKIWNGITTTLVALVALFAIGVWGVQLFGINIFVVLSGSMEPAYPVGSLVYVAETDPKELAAGDVITFNLSEAVRGTHRIIEVVEENGERAFRTKGDANEQEDSGLVTEDDLVGKVIFHLPRMGYMVNYLQSSQGRFAAISAIAVLLLLILLPDILFNDKRSKMQEEKK